MPEDDDTTDRDGAPDRDSEAFSLLDDEDALGQGGPAGDRDPGDVGPDASTAGDHPDGEERAPLSDLREDVERRRERDDGEDADDLFTEMEVGGVDDESVWDELSEGAATPSVGPGEAVSSEDDVHETREVTVVQKRLCHGCPHFADPPETACTHDGTTIEAEVDTDHFRVVDCPVVAEREEMEASDFSPDDL